MLWICGSIHHGAPEDFNGRFQALEIIPNRLCKEHLNGLLAGGSVLQCQTGIHLSTLGKLVASELQLMA